jgi:hypothetical protein
MQHAVVDLGRCKPGEQIADDTVEQNDVCITGELDDREQQLHKRTFVQELRQVGVTQRTQQQLILVHVRELTLEVTGVGDHSAHGTHTEIVTATESDAVRLTTNSNVLVL